MTRYARFVRVHRFWIGSTHLTLAVMILVIGLTGCAARYTKAYPGADLGKSQLAILSGEKRGSAFTAIETVTFKSVDGQELGNSSKGWPRTIHVLPGMHRLVVRYDSGANAGNTGILGALVFIALEENDPLFNPHFEASFEIEVAAGHEYIVRSKSHKPNAFSKVQQVDYSVEDSGTGEAIDMVPVAQ